jgi:hypothetical protein
VSPLAWWGFRFGESLHVRATRGRALRGRLGRRLPQLRRHAGRSDETDLDNAIGGNILLEALGPVRVWI